MKLGTFSCSGCTEGNYKSLKPIQLLISGELFELPVASYIKKIEPDGKFFSADD